MLIEDVWKTHHVWSFVVSELTRLGDNNYIKTIDECRNVFQLLLNHYINILSHTNLSYENAIKLWPFFSIFHFELDLRPFCTKIITLKRQFDSGLTKHSVSSKLESNFSHPSEMIDKDSFNFDQKLIMSVRNHVQEFSDQFMSQYNIWREITDEVNNHKPYQSNQVIKVKTRFYHLVKEYLQLSRHDDSESGKKLSQMQTLFTGLDLRPFMPECIN